MLEIGTTLRDARERLGLELADCERATRIRTGQLRALEEGRFDKLPEPPYTRGFIRAYAKVLGLDAERLVAEYDRLLGQDGRLREHALQPLPAPETRLQALRQEVRPPRRPGRGTALRWLALGGIVALGVLAWTGVSGRRSSPPEPAAPESVAPGAATTTQDRPPAPSPPARPVLAVTGLPPSGSYMQVRRGGEDGPLLYEGTVAPGSSRRWQVARPLWMRVGWTPSLRVRVGGRPAALSGGTANFIVSSSGIGPAEG
jgi:cytoskeleton protein RodZ